MPLAPGLPARGPQHQPRSPKLAAVPAALRAWLGRHRQPESGHRRHPSEKLPWLRCPPPSPVDYKRRGEPCGTFFLSQCWFQDERWYDLLTVLDDATSQIYYGQLVEEESTGKGLCCSIYSDRASHFWVTGAGG